MPGVAAIANTFNAPNFVGELFALTPTDTPFLSAIGGLTGGKRANGIVHTWSVYDLRPPDPNRQRTEGADAPAAETRVRGQDRNVLEIHQETVGVTYTRQAAQNMFASTGSAHPNAAALGGTNAVDNEMDWQTRIALVQIARDVEASFVTGTFQEPSTNSTARKTRGIIAATVTNVITNATPAALTEKMVLDLLQKVWENGGIQVSETAAVMCNAWQRRKLTDEFVTKKNYREETRNVGGVSVTVIETDFGRLSVMLNRHMPTDTVQVVSLDQCAPVLLETPGKGFLFSEPLAKTGATDRAQIYGEIGLEYGPEIAHGKITGLTTS
ncbi:MAG: SU10 major capsid protein [bacterium]